jgi:hypothetical protein
MNGRMNECYSYTGKGKIVKSLLVDPIFIYNKDVFRNNKENNETNKN